MPRTKGWKAKIRTDKTPPNIDLVKLCPELAAEVKIREANLEATKKSIFGSDENTVEALQNDLNRINAIAATMLKLAKALKRGAGDECLCALRKAQKVSGKCWRCDARALLAPSGNR